MSLRIAICDDENGICEEINRLAKQQAPDCSTEIFLSGEALLKSSGEYDLYFLDIQMGAINGIKTAEAIRQRQQEKHLPKSLIIFITGLREHMSDAFDVNAFHYLLKPINREKFIAVFDRAIEELETLRKENPSILLKDGDAHIQLFHKDIYFVESYNKKMLFHTADAVHEHYMKLSTLESELGWPFYRCHRCYLVNLGVVRRYTASSILLQNGETIPLAQKKYSHFVNAVMQYMKKDTPLEVPR